MITINGWKCGECGVVYAPFIKECRCAVKLNDQAECFHNWPERHAPCTKCGYVIPMPSFTFTPTVEKVDLSVCQHTWSEIYTNGRHCLNCGETEPLFGTPTTASTKVTVSNLPDEKIRKRS